MIKIDFASEGIESVLRTLQNSTNNWTDSYSHFLKQYTSGEHIEVKSSGSTGAPKTLAFTTQQYNASAFKSINYFEFKKGQTVASALPGNTVGGQLMLVRAYLAKMVLYLLPPKLNAFEEISERVDFAPMVGSQFQALLDDGKTKSFKQILLGGGPLIPSQLNALTNLKCEVFASYGMTETLSHVAVRNLSKQEKYYLLLPGNSAEINGKGCIELTCDYLPKKVSTTDLGTIHSQGLEIVGRSDFTIISSGKKIQPEEIEFKLKSFLHRDYLVAGKSSEQFGAIIGLLINSPLTDLEQEQIKQFNKKVATHEKIRFVCQTELCKTEQKILRGPTLSGWLKK